MKKAIFYKECQKPSKELSSKISYIESDNDYYYIPVNGYIEPTIRNIDELSNESRAIVIGEMLKNMNHRMHGGFDVYLVIYRYGEFTKTVKIGETCDSPDLEDIDTVAITNLLANEINNCHKNFIIDLFLLITSKDDYESDLFQLQTEIDNVIDTDGELHTIDECFGYITNSGLYIEDSILNRYLSENYVYFDSSVPIIVNDHYMTPYCVMNIDNIDCDCHDIPRGMPVVIAPSELIEGKIRNYPMLEYWIYGNNLTSLMLILNAMLISAKCDNSALYVNKQQIDITDRDRITVDEFFDLIKKTIVKDKAIPEYLILEKLSITKTSFVKLGEINPVVLYEDHYEHFPIIKCESNNLMRYYNMPRGNYSNFYDNCIQIVSSKEDK